MKQRWIGVLILAIVITVAVAIGIGGNLTTKAEIIQGYVGGEKMGFFNDEEVINLLKKKYNIQVEAVKAGSYEMVKADNTNQDFIFPSSQVAVELFKELYPNTIAKTERVFQSPIVIYSWVDIADVFVKEGIAKKMVDEYYTIDMIKFMDYIQVPSKKWSDLGLDLYGNIKVNCTDPNKSNSGNMYAGLLYTIFMEKGDSETQALKQIEDIFSSLGFMESSSGTLFESYLVKGKGANPLVVGYENQIVEFALENPEIWNNAKGNVAILVPEPTVWSEHPLIALNSKGEKLIEALSDSEIRELAWKKHGFRYPAFSNKDNTVVALPESLDQIVEMPSLSTMKQIMDLLEE